MIIIGRDRTGPKGKAHILSTPSVRWAFRCPGHMSFVFLEGSHPISSKTPHGFPTDVFMVESHWNLMIYEDLTYFGHFWTKNPRGPPPAQPRLLPSLLPDIRSSIRFAPMSAFAEQVPLRFGGTGAAEPSALRRGFPQLELRHEILDVNHGKMDENYGKINDL